MKFVCGRESLLSAVQQVKTAVAARTTKPVLSNVKAILTDNALTLIAYDMEVGIRYELSGVDSQELGVGILPVHEIEKILRNTEEETVLVVCNADKVVVKVGGSKFDMPGYDPDEFPDFNTTNETQNYHEILASDLKTMIRRTAFAADKKDTTAKFSLGGVQWACTASTARLVATDTKRLAISECPAKVYGDSDAKETHLIPLKAISLLERNLVENTDVVKVYLRQSDALFVVGSATIYTGLVNGKFPPYTEIMTKVRRDVSHELNLPTQQFLSRVRQAAIMTDDESMRVDMVFRGDHVTMKARGAKTGASEVTLPIACELKEMLPIAFDPTYVTDFLRAIEGNETFDLRLGGSAKAALFGCGEDYSYMLMPLTGD